MTHRDFRELEIKVIELLNKYFKGKKDKGGNDYQKHLYSVAGAIQDEEYREVLDNDSSLATYYRKATIVALLHDILEDTECTEDELHRIGCDDEIINAIKSVTRKKDEQYYFDFIERARKNDIGRLVKIYDLENNMDVRRLDKFGDYEQKRLRKYFYCWKYLKGKISAIECNNTIHPDRLLK